MKAITKLSALGLFVVALAGCQENNDKTGTADPTTGKSVSGQVPPEARKDPKAYYRKAGQAGMQGMQTKSYNQGKSGP